MSGNLSDAEIKQAAALLAKLEPGFLPFPIFHEVTRLTTTPIIEIVPLRYSSDKVEILLLQREHDDPVWPDKLHIPGTVIRATDSLDSAIDRILSKELGGITTLKPTFVKNILHHSGRGLEASQVYWVEAKDEPNVGQFYDANKLPERLVSSQLDFIPAVIDEYVRSKNQI